jgi:predicted PurR-regulated permease PerM
MGWLIFTIQPLIEPLIIAALLAYVLNPLVKLAQTRTRLGHRWAVSLVYFSSLALLLIVPSVLAPIALGQARRLTDDFVKIEIQLETILSQPLSIGNYQLHLGQLWASFLNKVTTELFIPGAQDTLAVLESTSISLLWIMVIIVSVYYFLLDWKGLQDWVIGLVPDSAQADVHRLLREIDLIWQAYLYGTLVLMLIVGVIFSLAWLAIGLPGAIALGLLMGLLTVIPDIGPMIGAILAILVAVFKGSDFLPLSNGWFAGLVFTIYLVLIQVKSIWLRPRVMKRFLRLNEGLIFVSIIGATVLWGILGALIIVPLLATLRVIGHYIRCRLLHLDPWPERIAPPSLNQEMQVEPGEALKIEADILALESQLDSHRASHYRL